MYKERHSDQIGLNVFKRSKIDNIEPFKGPSGAVMGFGPSLYIACYHFTGHRKAHFGCSAYTKFAEPIGSFQFGVGCFYSRTDFITVFPFRSLLIGIHLIPQTNPGGDLQAKITDCVARLAASTAMIGSSHHR